MSSYGVGPDGAKLIIHTDELDECFLTVISDGTYRGRPTLDAVTFSKEYFYHLQPAFTSAVKRRCDVVVYTIFGPAEWYALCHMDQKFTFVDFECDGVTTMVLHDGINHLATNDAWLMFALSVGMADLGLVSEHNNRSRRMDVAESFITTRVAAHGMRFQCAYYINGELASLGTGMTQNVAKANSKLLVTEGYDLRIKGGDLRVVRAVEDQAVGQGRFKYRMLVWFPRAISASQVAVLTMNTGARAELREPMSNFLSLEWGANKRVSDDLELQRLLVTMVHEQLHTIRQRFWEVVFPVSDAFGVRPCPQLTPATCLKCATVGEQIGFVGCVCSGV